MPWYEQFTITTPEAKLPEVFFPRRRTRKAAVPVPPDALRLEREAARGSASPMKKDFNGYIAARARSATSVRPRHQAPAQEVHRRRSQPFIANSNPKGPRRVPRPQAALAILAFRFRVARSSISRVHESHQPARSKKVETAEREKAKQTVAQLEAAQDLAAPPRRGDTLVERGRRTPQRCRRHVAPARMLIKFLGKANARC